MIELFLVRPLGGNGNVAGEINILQPIGGTVDNASGIYINGKYWLFGGMGYYAGFDTRMDLQRPRYYTPNIDSEENLGGQLFYKSRSDGYVFSHNDQIYFWSGLDGSEEEKTVYIYNQTTNSFTSALTATYPTTSGTTVVYGDGKFFVFPANSDTFMYWDFASSQWINMTGIPRRFTYARAVCKDKKLYIFSGYDYTNLDLQSKMMIYDIETNTWSYGTDWPTEIIPEVRIPASVVVGDNIYIYGGRSGGYKSKPIEYHNTLLVYHIPTGTWSSLGEHGLPVMGAASIYDGSHIYFIGGNGGSGYLSTNTVIQVTPL